MFNSPCFIPSPQQSRAFSLVRKVQGRLPAAGEAPNATQRATTLTIPQKSTPASSTKQKNKEDGAPLHIIYLFAFTIIIMVLLWYFLWLSFGDYISAYYSGTEGLDTSCGKGAGYA